MNNRYRITKSKSKRFLIISILLLVTLVITLVRCGQIQQAEELRLQKERAESALSAEQRAKNIAKAIDGESFGIIADHELDLDTAIASYLKKDYSDFKLKIKSDVDFEKPGDHSVSVHITDKAKVTSKANFTVEVVDLNEPGDFEFLTQNGFIGQRKNGITTIDGTKIVNKTFSIPRKFGKQITQATVDAYFKMEEAASNDGIFLVIQSDYRSYKDQQVVYEGYVKKSGQNAADRYSARPGHSEHQLGEALDLNVINQSFADTPEGQWLNKNCSRFGFIIRYPEGKHDKSMYIAEPWHLRYVGRDLSEKLHNGGNWITLEEHFGIDSKYEE